MADPEALQRTIVRRLRKERPAFAMGMKWALAEVIKKPGGSRWRPCESELASLERMPQRWVGWLDELVRHSPPPGPIQLLWFEFPSELNPALTSVSGYPRIDPTEEAFGCDEARSWPVDDDGSTSEPGLLLLPELDTFLALAGWRLGQYGEERQSLECGYYALAAAVVVLCVLNELPKSRLAAILPGPVGVVVGFASGDVIPLGMLSKGAWSPLRARAAREAKPDELDPSSLYFDLKKYLARGGDPNWKDPKNGKPLLHHFCYSDTKVVRMLLDAGADPRVSGLRGEPTLHQFGAAEIEVLDALVAAGADPKATPPSGGSLLRRFCGDGRCTVRHLDWCVQHGVEPPGTGIGFFPLHGVATSGLYERSRLESVRALAKWWIARGFDINESDNEGYSPLARCMSRYAIEMDEHIVQIKRRPEISGFWNYRSDRIAEMLLKLGADPNARIPKTKSRRIPVGGTPLMVRRYDMPLLVGALLKHGAGPFLQCARGRTALHYAKEAARASDRPGNEAATEIVRLLERAMKSTGRTRR